MLLLPVTPKLALILAKEIFSASIKKPSSDSTQPADTEGKTPHLLLAPNREEPSPRTADGVFSLRSEEHTSELQSRENLVCRLLLEKKKKKIQIKLKWNNKLITTIQMNK